jgi:cathepsin A (carboxypeptidase C)
MVSFYMKFPEYQNNDLYISGESYAGIYLPTLAMYMLTDPLSFPNFKVPRPGPRFVPHSRHRPPFSLSLSVPQGIAVANGYLSPPLLTNALVGFFYFHGLVDDRSAFFLLQSVEQHLPAVLQRDLRLRL